MLLQAMLQRNLVVKSFCDIPMADMEMIFPEKSVYIKPFILIQLVVTVVLAVFTILSTLVQVGSSSIGITLSSFGRCALAVVYGHRLPSCSSVADALFEWACLSSQTLSHCLYQRSSCHV